MPIEWSADKTKNRANIIVTGEVHFSEVIKNIDEIVNSSDLKKGYTIFSDHSGVMETLRLEDAKRLVSYFERLGDAITETRWAIAASNTTSFGTFRMVSTLAERIPMNIGVFMSREEALAWLDAGRKK